MKQLQREPLPGSFEDSFSMEDCPRYRSKIVYHGFLILTILVLSYPPIQCKLRAAYTLIKSGTFWLCIQSQLTRKIEKTIPDLLQLLPAQEVCGCLELACEEQPGFHGIVVQSHLLVPVRVPLQFTRVSQ
jgi:hypothetical protein